MVRAPSALLGALFVLPLLPFAAAQCMQSWEQTPFHCLIMPAWLLCYQPSPCLLFHNLLVSCGFCLAGHLRPGFLIALIIRLVP